MPGLTNGCIIAAGVASIPWRFDKPDEDRISTSFAERLNLSAHMHNRRMTRLTSVHSKSFSHHSAMMSIFAAWFDYCRPHMTRKQANPRDGCRVWPIEELLTRRRSIWPLDSKASRVPVIWRSINKFKNQLADLHSSMKLDWQWPDIPHLKLQ